MSVGTVSAKQEEGDRRRTHLVMDAHMGYMADIDRELLEALSCELEAVARRIEISKLVRREDLTARLESHAETIRQHIQSLEPDGGAAPVHDLEEVAKKATVATNATDPGPPPPAAGPEPVSPDIPATASPPEATPTPQAPARKGNAAKAAADLKAQSRALTKAQQAFFERERGYVGRGSKDQEANELKALICEARALIEWARDADADDSNLRVSFRSLERVYNKQNPDGSFFGLNLNRTHRKEHWLDLEIAYSAFDAAEQAVAWLEGTADLPERDRTELLISAASVESLLYRIFQDHVTGVTERVQLSLHERIANLQNETRIPWWDATTAKRPSLQELKKRAKDHPDVYKDVRARHERRARADRAFEAFEEMFLVAADGSGDLEHFVVSVRNCLESGIPPSDKRLVTFCVPYRSLLEGEGDRSFEKLISYVDKQITQKKLIEKRAWIDQDKEEDEEYAMQLETVKGQLSGTTVLFVGGQRSEEKKEEIIKVLDLADLIWPDGDKSTPASEYKRYVSRSDVVCYLVRWSRKGYKEVIDDAKRDKKKTVIIKAGVGIRRLVHDMYHQVCAPTATAQAARACIEQP